MADAPQMLYAEKEKDFDIGGGYKAILFHKIESADDNEYEYILAVHSFETEHIGLFVTSIVNEKGSESAGDSHILGIFPGSGYENLGASNDWGDINKFRNEAVKVTVERLGITLGQMPGEPSCSSEFPTEH